MTDPISQAKIKIQSALCASVIASPMDSGLDWSELQEVVEAHGVGRAAFNRAWQDLQNFTRDSRGRIHPEDYWGELSIAGLAEIPDDLRPADALDALRGLFDELANTVDEREPKAMDLLHARLPRVPADELDLAVGLLVAWGNVERGERGFVRKKEWPEYRVPPHPHHRDWPTRHVDAVRALLPTVREAILRRSGQAVPTATPRRRFGDFLKKQGWTALHGWWSMTTAEEGSLAIGVQNTAVCTLTTALLEGALVAISHPAQAAGQWRQAFLKQSPDTWKLGQLIDQTEAAGTFSSAQAAFARDMADMRNRIHVGKFSTSGTSPFHPPYSNDHEARQCREHLDRLLAALLDWGPIRVIT